MIADNGTYTYRYDSIFVSAPGRMGDTHTVNISCKIKNIITQLL